MSEQSQADHQAEDKETTLMDHLIELRDRLIRMLLSVLITFVCLFWVADEIFTLVSQPLSQLLPEGSSLIATAVTSPFLVPFKLVLMVSVLIMVPYLLHQIWAFVAPGLYRHEKRLALPLLVSSVVLFYCGIAFAYFVVLPLLFGFFIGITPDGVEMMTDIGQYLSFIIAIFFAFGIAFEVPVATFLLIAAGATTPEKLADKRPYVFLGAFVIGMLLTPPDIISQVILAVPIYMLFEMGLIMSRIFLKPKEVITNNDEYEIIEEEMDKLFDEMEQEEAENNRRP